MLTKKRSTVAPGRKAARLFSRQSLLRELYYNFSRLQGASDLFQTFTNKSALHSKRLVYKSHYVDADFLTVAVHLETLSLRFGVFL